MKVTVTRYLDEIHPETACDRCHVTVAEGDECVWPVPGRPGELLCVPCAVADGFAPERPA